MTDERPRPRIYNIPAGRPFVDSLAAGIQAAHGSSPDALARTSVLLPTRRACLALRDAFLRQTGGKPMLLPRLLPLGDMDEDELLIGASELPGLEGEEGFSLPPAVPALRRQLLLTRLIQARPDSDTTPDQAIQLARELARLLDQVHTERGDFSNLAELVPEAFADHWRITLDFLKIITEVWPRILAEEGCIDAADRRNRLLETRARIWQTQPPGDPIYAAGSTGSIPATADLLGVISRLPEGAVVLPGLDQKMAEAVWDELEPYHPQYGMAQLIAHLGAERNDVIDWPTAEAAETPPSRSTLINAALVPAGAPTGLDDPAFDVDGSLSGVTRIDCPSPQEEAMAIALILRQTLEQSGRTAALVTPDRALARRVQAEMNRWGVGIDDSAGRPLLQTPVGAFLRLIADVAADDLPPVTLLALLKHPLAAAGMETAALRRVARILEIECLRGPRPGGGFENLSKALPEKMPELSDLIVNLRTALGPLLEIMQRPPQAGDVLTDHLVRAAEALATTPEETGAQRLWTGDDGAAAAGFIGEMMEWGGTIDVPPRRYSSFFAALMAGRVVRPRYGVHPRLAIWGLLEARLQRADVLILGGLNEGSWPPEVQASPWMSRPMMAAFGLPLPERRIGLAAHDFVQGFAAPEVVLTRAERVEGTPTVPCRWLRRLDNLIERLGGSVQMTPDVPWLAWARVLDQPATPRIAGPPRPKPPLADRPERLFVTQIETLIRDPYAVYARHVLKLRPLDPLDADPGAADRGSIIHKALEVFVDRYKDRLPDDAEAQLLDIGRQVFDNYLTRPGVRAFWWPRFERIAEWFVSNERTRRAAGFQIVATEAQGEWKLEGLARDFILAARVDRIDRRADVGLAIIDYKTGQPPSDKQVAAGLAPQLPLEAIIASQGGFPGVPPETVAQLAYMRLSGGRQPGQERAVKLDVGETVANVLTGLARLIHKYENPETPYLSQPRPMFLGRFSDYDHLARVKEWRGRS